MSQTLSSDTLEQQFGPTEVVVLHQGAGGRIICTRTVDGGRVLEVSCVAFAEDATEQFEPVHQAVLAGRSIGKAFRDADIAFVRETRAAYRQSLPTGFQEWFGGRESATVVAVTVLGGPNRKPYAEILETYSPEVRWPQLYGETTAEDRAIIQKLNAFLLDRSRQ